MKNIILLLPIFLLFTYCKKKENTSETPIPPIPATLTQQFDGFFKVTTGGGWNNQLGIGSIYSPNVYLQSAPSATYNYMYCVNSGTVFVNDISLKFGAIYYYDTTYTLKCRTLRKFQFNSNGTLPSFTVNITDSVPAFPANYYSLMSDTMFKSKNFVIPLTVFSYPDEIECLIYDFNDYTKNKKITVKKGVSEIVLTPGDISIFPDNASLNCQITLRKFNDQSIGGKNFRFSTELFAYFDVKVQP